MKKEENNIQNPGDDVELTINEPTVEEQAAPQPSPEEQEEAKRQEAEAREAAARKHDEETAQSLKTAIRKTAKEEEEPKSYKLSLSSILGGDMLSAQMLRSQIWLMLLIVFITIIYVASRYNCQQDMIEMDALQKELIKSKYRALSSTSDLTEKTRESKVLDALHNNNDTLLHISSEPPYIITIDE